MNAASPTPGAFAPAARGPALGALTALLLVITVSAVMQGALPIDGTTLWDELLTFRTSHDQMSYVLWQLRLPRVALAALIGAGLALAGAALQTLFRNPLADPGLVGVSSGAALGAVLCLNFRGSIAAAVPAVAGVLAVPVMAFAGGLAATAGMFALVRERDTAATAQLLLFGVAMNALCGALIGCVLFTATDQTVRDFTFWNLGSLSGASWVLAGPVAAATLFGGLLLLGEARRLDAWALGEQAAEHLGVNTRRTRRRVILAASLIVGAAVAAAGIIGFIGLVVPHLARGVVGASHRSALPASALLGAALVVAADLASRTLVLPAELPIGIVTALAGTPFLVWLVRRGRALRGSA